MSEVYDFLKENKMLFDSFDRKKSAKAFLKDMKEKKTLGMFKTYQKVSSVDSLKGKILAIDAGGTNLRFAPLEDGEVKDIKAMPMFGSKEEMTVDTFFDLMAAEIDKYDADRVGFCFSYPCSIQENKDGKIVSFAKEIKIKGAKGRLLGEELNKRLKTKREFSVLNDTVAAQLGTGADIGIILGTGFNICYTDPTQDMIIVSECGLYQGFPQGKFDEMLCSEMHSPLTVAEKLISGAYLGKLIEITAREYFGPKLPEFELIDVSEFLIGEGKLYECLSPNERNEFREMISLIQQRGASYVALMLECLLSVYKKEGQTLKVALEGSTIYKMPGYHEALKDAFDEIQGFDLEFVDARGMLLYGCARSF